MILKRQRHTYIFPNPFRISQKLFSINFNKHIFRSMMYILASDHLIQSQAKVMTYLVKDSSLISKNGLKIPKG
jgi:hypothetical protein